MEGAAHLLTSTGEVHLTHKVGLQQWAIGQQGGAESGSPLIFAGAVLFDRSAYPPYRPLKALVPKSFPTTDAQTFIFARGGGARGMSEGVQ